MKKRLKKNVLFYTLKDILTKFLTQGRQRVDFLRKHGGSGQTEESWFTWFSMQTEINTVLFNFIKLEFH